MYFYIRFHLITALRSPLILCHNIFGSEIEKANDPTHVGTSPAPPDKVPKEEVESSPAEGEEDGEKSTFTIRGQQVSYPVPDAYIGKEFPTDAPSQTLELNWV